MAERLPILHLVGTPSTGLQGRQALLHHTLGNGDFTAFADMSSHIVATLGLLKPGGRLTEEVDRVLGVALTECRPVYLTLPTDLVHTKVSAESLKKPLPHPHSAPPRGPPSLNDRSAEDELLSHVVERITARFKASKKPIVIIDACAERFGCADELRKLVEGSGVRFFETPMGKASLDESHPQYGGAYVGANSLPAVREEVESADFILMAGRLESDFNSGSFTFDLPVRHTVELHSFETKIGFATYPPDIRTILPLLTKSFTEAAKSQTESRPVDKQLREESDQQRDSAQKVPELGEGAGKGGIEGSITHKWFWPRMGKFFKERDIIVAETGTSAFGIINVPFPSKASCLAQTLWGSIGWATGATLGAALAAQEQKEPNRTILFTGDGSLQLTVQEVGTMIRRGVSPYLFVLNNDGYEIERQIHGKTAEYNNIQLYDHQLLLPFFAGKKSKHPYQSYEVHTPAELNKLLDDPEFNKPDRLRLIEVYMPRDDAPAALINQGKLTAEANAV